MKARHMERVLVARLVDALRDQQAHAPQRGGRRTYSYGLASGRVDAYAFAIALVREAADGYRRGTHAIVEEARELLRVELRREIETIDVKGEVL